MLEELEKNARHVKLLPLVVDLDGTLIRTDMLLESGLDFLRRHPVQWFKPLLWLAQGKANLKRHLAYNCQVDVAVLPYNEAVLDVINVAKKQGRLVVLATASDMVIAKKIADHLGVFDMVLASDNGVNLSAHNKRARLIEEFGQKGFDYVGNSTDDLVVWAVAANALVVDPEKPLRSRIKKIDNLANVVITHKQSWQVWAKSMRMHQWMKNLLIFVPLFAAHQVTDFAQLKAGLLAFVFFGLCASSVYLLNDLLDLSDDRHHAIKKNRPLAAGRLPISVALILVPMLLAMAFVGSMVFLPFEFTLVLLLYYLTTLAYSLVLKRWMGVDVIVLALLYALRIIAGAAAFSLALTFWLLAFAIFIFLSLALVKRYAELNDARQKGRNEKSRGRGYYPGDLEMIASLGAASGYISVLVLALYINELPNFKLYQNPQVVWAAVPLLLFWITRTWMLAHRGKMHDDPVVFALRDRPSLCIGVIFACVFYFAM